jgi:hypothetical protein
MIPTSRILGVAAGQAKWLLVTLSLLAAWPLPSAAASVEPGHMEANATGLLDPERWLQSPPSLRLQLRQGAEDMCRRAAYGLTPAESYTSPDGGNCYWGIDLTTPSSPSAGANLCNGATGEARALGCAGGADQPSLFFFASGDDAGISNMRFKLNATPGLAALERGSLAEAAARLLAAVELPALPSALHEAILAGTPMREAQRGLLYSFIVEAGPLPRYDLDLLFLAPPVSNADAQVRLSCATATVCRYVLEDR